MLLFLGLGFGELLVVFFFVLLFFGADSIPKIARTLGRGIRQMKDATQEIQEEIKKSSSGITDEIKKSTTGFTDEINKVESDVKKTLDQ
jgi:sec-independent protein translocase protein TatA